MPADGREEIEWAPRVRKLKIRRLYESDARGIVDEELLDDVGTALYCRCRSILTVTEAKAGRVRCPRCDRGGTETIIERGRGREQTLLCPRCGWSLAWEEYQRSFKRRQLNSGGALPGFTAFVRRWPRARTPQDKMLAIDHLIHEFHYSLREQPDLPTRPAAVNLIDGKLTDVMAFLDELAYGDHGTAGLAESLEAWRREAHRLPWNPLRDAAE